MQNKETKLNDLIVIGNTMEDGYQNNTTGWFIGTFIDPANRLRCTEDIEIKWGVHSANEEKSSFGINEKATSLAILIKGSCVFNFPDLKTSISLKKQGDYVIYAPGVSHNWKVLEDSIVLTIRWPSIIGDQKKWEQ